MGDWVTNKYQIIAHKGNSSGCPENSTAANNTSHTLDNILDGGDDYYLSSQTTNPHVTVLLSKPYVISKIEFF